MPRPQFTLRALLVAMLAVGCFLGGIHFERERRRRALERVEYIVIPPYYDPPFNAE
ncbi:MAG TPA: hypothetical protein VHC22_20165 [Pirellulales bacterium]|nr:hypothetical protein [Pirellulales bacterium]